ncbi:hypothetical protein HPB50_017756 [Hyalomma asiaticum]|uniref:Uncharacterized protein n=1 Tax=Hyalomma asiaticum TaxID=266040 RepID=A0ACB7SEZ6_HYAAI|nr:hypothetical protein HPB50_017756 [Hyalomma asiaticum]
MFGARGASLLMPSLTKKRAQLPGAEVTMSRKLSSVRIHVEQSIQRLKAFRLFHMILPVSFVKRAGDVGYATIDKLAIVCCGLVNLQTPIINAVHDDPAEQNAYTALKQLLIRRLTPSEPQRLQQLLHNTELGDRTPSQLLRQMRQLLHTDGATTTDADSRPLRELFLQRLPVNVRMILASAADKRLSELAELADSVVAVAPPSVAALQPDIAGRAPTTALYDIREQISRLADTVAAMQARSTPDERQPKRECAIVSSIMWYHLVKNTGGIPQRERSSALSNMASFSTSTFYSRRPRLSDKEAEWVLEAIANNDTSDDEVDDRYFVVGDAAFLPRCSNDVSSEEEEEEQDTNSKRSQDATW